MNYLIPRGRDDPDSGRAITNKISRPLIIIPCIPSIECHFFTFLDYVKGRKIDCVEENYTRRYLRESPMIYTGTRKMAENASIAAISLLTPIGVKSPYPTVVNVITL